MDTDEPAQPPTDLTPECIDERFAAIFELPQPDTQLGRSVLFFDKRGVPMSPHAYSEAWSDMDYRRIGRDEITPEVVVSTVWLGIDHGMSSNLLPLIFETMVFAPGLPCNEETERWVTEDGARAGHAAMVERVRKIVAEEEERERQMRRGPRGGKS